MTYYTIKCICLLSVYISKGFVHLHQNLSELFEDLRLLFVVLSSHDRLFILMFF